MAKGKWTMTPARRAYYESKKKKGSKLRKAKAKVSLLERRLTKARKATVPVSGLSKTKLKSMLSKARTKVGKIASKPTSTFLDYDKGSRRRMKNAFKKAGRM